MSQLPCPICSNPMPFWNGNMNPMLGAPFNRLSGHRAIDWIGCAIQNQIMKSPFPCMKYNPWPGVRDIMQAYPPTHVGTNWNGFAISQRYFTRARGFMSLTLEFCFLPLSP